MMMFEKYILRLLSSRFFVILACTIIFGLLQEITREKALSVCTFWQMMLILPLTTPMILFLFFPFIYLGTLLLVISEMHSNNEQIILKSIGISDWRISRVFFYFSIFGLFVFIVLGLLYPATNRLLLRQKNIFSGSNLLKSLKPNQVNKFGKYDIFFTKIDADGKLKNVNIVINNKNKTKKIVFSDSILLNYNKFDELIAHCWDSDILTIKFSNEEKQKTETIITTQTATHVKEMDVLLSDFFQQNNDKNTKYKQRLRQIGLLTLLKIKPVFSYEGIVKKTEIHGRAVVYWFVITALTFLCCVLLRRKPNRFSSWKITLFIVTLSLLLALSRAFVLELAIINNMLFFYYTSFVFICFVCIFFLKRKKL